MKKIALLALLLPAGISFAETKSFYCVVHEGTNTYNFQKSLTPDQPQQGSLEGQTPTYSLQATYTGLATLERVTLIRTSDDTEFTAQSNARDVELIDGTKINRLQIEMNPRGGPATIAACYIRTRP